MDLSELDSLQSEAEDDGIERLPSIQGEEIPTDAVLIDRDKFRVLTECIGLASSLQCTDCDIKNGILRQYDSNKYCIIYMDMTAILGNRNFCVSNAAQKHSVMKALEVDDSVEWANQQIKFSEEERRYYIIDPVSTVQFTKPDLKYLDNKFMGQGDFESKTNLTDENLAFQIEIEPFMSKRIRTICDGIGTDVLTCRLRKKANLLITGQNKVEDLSAKVVGDIPLQIEIPNGDFTVTVVPFRVSDTAMRFSFYKLKKFYMCVFEKNLFNCVPFALYALVNIDNS